ncbi:MAG: hypothetical protein L6R39_001480 [Caloplaca ligustica]|nr:MAG: hypothetical protein L6R39_001480 [Caloplaca ligustica]
MPKMSHELNEVDKENDDPKPRSIKLPKPNASKFRTAVHHPNAKEAVNQPPHECHLVRLPPEILNAICDLLQERDMPALRVQCRYLCDIATSHILHSVHLRLKKTSISSLLELSKHPILSHNVQTLLYEPNFLEKQTRDAWEKEISLMNLHRMKALPPTPKESASERERRFYQRAIRKVLNERQTPYTQEELDLAWSIYRRYLQEQDELIERDYASEDIYEAIKGFPDLTGVHINHGWGLWMSDVGERAYEDALCEAGSAHTDCEFAGLQQTLSLLRTLSKAEKRLLSLRIGTLNWRFFEEFEADKEFFGMMKEIVLSLQDIKLFITTWSDMDDEEDETNEIVECRAYLGNGMLGRLLAEAPGLRKLSIAFDANEHFCPMDFQHLALDTRWPHLHTVKLESIDTPERDWIAFFERHATTIKHLSIKSIRLEEGEWADVLERMQRLLDLEEANFGQSLLGDNPNQMWYLDPIGHASSTDDSVQSNRTRWALEGFMVHGGVCPLRDEEAHPEVPFID